MISSLSALDFIRNDPTNVGRVWDQMQISGLSPSRVPAALAGYRLAGPSRSDNLPLSAEGAISQRIYHQKRQKKESEGHYNVIASYPAAPKSTRDWILFSGGQIGDMKGKGGGTVIGRERDTLTDRKWERGDCLEITDRGGRAYAEMHCTGKRQCISRPLDLYQRELGW